MCYLLAALLHLGCLPVVQPEVVAGLEVEGDGGVRDGLQVDRQHFLRHVIVVQLVVTQGHVHLQRQEVSTQKQEVISIVVQHVVTVYTFRDRKSLHRNRKSSV